MSNMVVRTNINSLNAHRNMKNTGAQQRQASNRLSSGYRINSAADDAAGLAISETMRAQIRGLDQANRNTLDGIGLIQTAEGGMHEIGAMIHRMRELVVQAANDTNDLGNRKHIQLEIDQLTKEIDKMAHRVEFNGMRLLDGSFAKANMFDFFELGDGFITVGYSRFNYTINPGVLRAFDLDGNIVYYFGDRDDHNFHLAQSVSKTGRIPSGELVTIAKLSFGENDSFSMSSSSITQDRVIVTAPDGTRFAFYGPNHNETTSYGTNSMGGGYTGHHIAANIRVNPAGWTPSTLRFDRISAAGAGVWTVEVESLTHYDPFGNVIFWASAGIWVSRYSYDSLPHDSSFWFQTGANSGQGLSTHIEAMHAKALGIRDSAGNQRVDVVKESGEEISELVKILDYALKIVNFERATLGAIQNRLEYTERSLSISSENLSDAESRVRNADMAREMMDFMQMNVLFQSGMLMMAQANQLPNMVLQLLQN